ncbi:type II toxin-antitoxin system VapB family antitoxin [Allomesorhizobium camelthorni]|jgi:antitoxin VapB|uniref:Type II toxin-antitoxin system VapB family antitoxin n=1 Tax=Allomesorhizobium camelthorni TaxID=475069 RepID=A0A6G4W5W8_9HYPH|nr:type II toxin-antitoxin system VapB family antitoxin [Mesorhizobium camelthorni]NGO50132.1 type II toxin-antitoxin system VapB family antitoxin [Mesorhizobium camelthorni]HEV2900078.1 type II toxin-antitoxin system VapB family antitoxin [Pseudaminobacter sp.]
MDLIVDDPRAEALARELAERRNISVNEAVIEALEAELGKSKAQQRPAKDREQFLARVREIQADLKARSKPGGRDLTKDEIDEMWGHE